jgi:predicted chitinase
MEQAFNKYTHYYNLKSRPIKFTIGQKVWKKRFRQSKLAKNYNAKYDDIYEPVIILKKMGNVYEIKNDKGKYLGTVHAKDLKA